MCDQLSLDQCHETVVGKMQTKISGVSAEYNGNSQEKCSEWVENCRPFNNSLDDSSSYSQTDDEESFDCSSSITSSECSQIVKRVDSITLTNETNVDAFELEKVIKQNSNIYENIIISESKNVHLGNVTVIHGPVYINDSKKQRKTHKNDVEIFEMPEHLKAAEAKIRWVDRRAWLSQPAEEEYEKLKAPAKFVIICHSATEDATDHNENIVIVRYIQQFHIECRKWADIAYNFLIGCDGYTYKGRGWGIRGAHSFRYNAISIGICFVGTFCKKLPPQIALDQAKALIRHGVTEGEIDKDYSLIGNCQVSSSKSPGECLYEEIKTWDHYDPTITLENPSPLIQDA